MQMLTKNRSKIPLYCSVEMNKQKPKPKQNQLLDHFGRQADFHKLIKTIPN